MSCHKILELLQSSFFVWCIVFLFFYVFSMSWKILFIVDNMYNGLCLSCDCHILCRCYRSNLYSGLHQVIVSIYWVELFVPPWLYKIPCECNKVYFGEMGRCMHDRIKEHYRDLWLLRTQTSAVFEYANMTRHFLLWDEVKFIDKDPHWYSRRVKEAIHIRLHPNNINRDCGIEIPEVWVPMIRQHSSRSLPPPLREQFPPLIIPTILWIKTHQPWTRLVILQSQATMVVQIVLLSKLTQSPDEDVQYLVETLWSISMWQSWD